MEFEVGELKEEYAEILQALALANEQGFFPLRTSGSITLHYDSQGKLSKLVPSPYIKVEKKERA